MKSIYKIKTKWREVDPMYFVRFEVYLDYYREACSDVLLKSGYSYSRLEELGVELPVIEITAKYQKPLRYDENIRIESWISKLKSYQVVVMCRVFNSKNEQTAEAKIIYGVLSKETEEPMPLPDDLKENLTKWVEK